MPETIHCKICGQAIHAESFEDGMAKLRRHRKTRHPTAFEASVKKGVATRRKKE